MSLAQLTADVQSWTHRTDLGTVMARFVVLVETKMNRALRTRYQETDITGTIGAGNVITLPTDYAATKTLWADGYESRPLLAQSREFVVARDQTSGPPSYYAVTDAEWLFDGTGDITVVYYKKIPSLSDNATNWVDENHYDAYLLGTLAEAYKYMHNDAKANEEGGRFAAVLAEINREAQAYAGPLVSQRRR